MAKKEVFFRIPGLFLVIMAAAIFLAWLDPYRDEVSRGNSEYQSKKYDRSKSHYNKAEKYAPGESDKKNLAFNKGNADYMAGKYESAILNYKKALQSEDKDVQKKAFFNLGNTYLKLNNKKEAVNSYINALKLDPDYKKAKNNIEYLLSEKKNRDNRKDKRGKDKKDKGKKGKDKEDQNKRNKDKGKSGDKNREEHRNKGENKKRGGRLNREQVKNILKSMKNKPVRRRKGNSSGRYYLEKNW